MSSNQLIENLMEDYVVVIKKTQEHPQCHHYNQEFTLPIDKVNGVKCSVSYVLRYQSIQLHITSCDVYENDGGDFRELYREDLASCFDYNDKNKQLKKDDFVMALVNLKKTLAELSFDKYYGKFFKENQKRSGKEFASLLADMDNIKLTCDACCVCSINTNTKTPCKHSLCVECWDSIHIQDKNSLDEKIPCPICRENIMFIKDDE